MSRSPPSPHRLVLASSGSIHFSAGDVHDNIRTFLFCTLCSKEFPSNDQSHRSRHDRSGHPGIRSRDPALHRRLPRRKYVTVQALPVDRKIVFPFKYSDFSGPFTSSHTTLLADCLKNVVNLDTDPVNA